MAEFRKIELAFRKVWLYLYNRGVGPEYTHALGEFVVAAIAAYRSGYALSALKLELVDQQLVTGNPELDLTLALTDEEVEVRNLWLRLVYLTLEDVGVEGPAQKCSSDDPSQDETGIELLVAGVVRAHTQGYTLDTLKLELLLDSTPPQLRDPQQTVLLSQWMRIVFICLETLKKSSE